MEQNDRITPQLAAIVDQAILLHEQGQISAAYRLLSENQISMFVAHRVFTYPERRRSYINDYLNGY